MIIDEWFGFNDTWSRAKIAVYINPDHWFRSTWNLDYAEERAVSDCKYQRTANFSLFDVYVNSGALYQIIKSYAAIDKSLSSMQISGEFSVENLQARSPILNNDFAEE